MVFRRPGIYKKEERSGTKAPQGQPDPGAFFMEILLLFLVDHISFNEDCGSRCIEVKGVAVPDDDVVARAQAQHADMVCVAAADDCPAVREIRTCYEKSSHDGRLR